VIPPEVAALPEDDSKALVEQVHEMRERLGERLRAQAAHLQKLEEGLKQLRDEHEQLEGQVWDQFEALGEPKSSSPSTPLEAVLAAARNLLTATLPKQVFNKLTEEGYRMGVRAVAFEIRGKAAWAASAHGFGSQVAEQTLCSLVVPLSVDTPFRQVFETGEPFGGNSDTFKKNPNVLSRLRPDSNDSVLLLPIRAAGAVSAILYVDSGGSGALPEDALKLLAEFAGAQLERLMALGGRATTAVSENADAQAQPESAASLEPPTAAEVEHSEEDQRAIGVPPSPGLWVGTDASQFNEAEQKAHQDARRLARLLVSEIELYNKTQVLEGRKSKDLYKRLKPEIERSRQTYGQRFGETVGKQSDYFHDELVRTLAGNDPSLLGSDCPGPSV